MGSCSLHVRIAALLSFFPALKQKGAKKKGRQKKKGAEKQALRFFACVWML